MAKASTTRLRNQAVLDIRAGTATPDYGWTKAMGSRARKAREHLGMSQDDLGKKVGKGKGMISGMERGAFPPSIETLIGVGTVLGTGVDAIVYGDDASKYTQKLLPGLSLDDRVQALPEAMRQAVIECLRQCERASKAVPARFLTPPTGEDLNDFMSLLEQLSKNLPPTDE